MTSTTAQIARKRSDDIFFPGMSLLALAVVVAAFGHSYFFAGMTAARLPSPLVHIHAAILTAWIVLQVLQPLQVAVARVDWHQRVGLAGTGVAAAVPVIGVLAGIGQIRRHEASLAHLTGDFAFVLAAAISFSVLAFIGLRERNLDLSAHKRLMLLATISILGPAIGRLPFVSSDAIYFVTLALFGILMVAFDLLSLRRIHRATILGLAVIAFSQASADLFSRTAAATDLVTWIERA